MPQLTAAFPRAAVKLTGSPLLAAAAAAAVGAVQHNQRSLSNGCLMRVAPLAVWAHQQPADVIAQHAMAQTALTHPNKTAQASPLPGPPGHQVPCAFHHNHFGHPVAATHCTGRRLPPCSLGPAPGLATPLKGQCQCHPACCCVLLSGWHSCLLHHNRTPHHPHTGRPRCHRSSNSLAAGAAAGQRGASGRCCCAGMAG